MATFFLYLSLVFNVNVWIEFPNGDSIEWVEQSPDLRYLGYRFAGTTEETDYAIALCSREIYVQYPSRRGCELATIFKW